MGEGIVKRDEIERIIARIESVKEGTESFPDLSDVVQSMREEEDR